jgi:mono/diheme cytochrome c family protein
MRGVGLVVALLISSFAVASGGKRDWLAEVPEKERGHKNPLAESEEAAAAGAILFRRSCASCHGEDARGTGKRPSLRTERVRRATDGELHWLLTNGQLGEGMPSWSRLPEVQRWQLIRYLHSLNGEGTDVEGALAVPK